MQDPKDTRPSRHKTGIQVNSERLWQDAQVMQQSKPDGFPALKENVDTSPHT